MNLTKILFIIIMGILIIFGIVGFIIHLTSNNMCKDVCLSKGTIFYEKIHSGNWALDDMCVCYLDNGKIETRRLGR